MILCAITAILALLSIFLVISDRKGSKKAYIYSEGELIRTVLLDEDTGFTVSTEKGHNVITVRNGKIGVTEADCPDKTCVHTGFTDNPFLPVICIPHRLEITVRDE